MRQKISLFCFIAILLSVIYLNKGCNILKPVPTPTAIPTITPVPTFTPTPEPTKDPKAFLITPGKGISDLQINKSTLDDVKKLLGDPNALPIEEQGNIKLVYGNDKLTFWFTPDKKMLRGIWIQNDSYKTSEGIGIGSNLMDIQNTYKDGALNKDKKIYYSNDGMDFYYDAGIITSIFLSDRDPLPTPLPPVPQDYILSAKKAINALQSIESNLGMPSLTFEEYKDSVLNANVIIDRFLLDYPKEYIPDLNSYISNAKMCHKSAVTNWDMDNKMKENFFGISENYDGHFKESRNKDWSFAKESTKRAFNLLTKGTLL